MAKVQADNKELKEQYIEAQRDLQKVENENDTIKTLTSEANDEETTNLYVLIEEKDNKIREQSE